MIAQRLRQHASFMRLLPRADGWHKAYLIDEVEVQKISATMIAAAERIEALEARAIPDTHRVVSVELLKEAGRQLSELKTFAAIRAIIEDKQP